MSKIPYMLLVVFFALSSLGLTPAEKVIVNRVGEANKTLKQNLKDTEAKLTWTYKELADTEPKIKQLGEERDQFKMLYERDHEKMLKQAAHILKLYMIIGIMTLAIGAYLVAKFYFRLPI